MSALLLYAAVPFSRELEQSDWYRRRMQELLETAVLASVVEQFDMQQLETGNGAGVVDLRRRPPAAGAPQAERDQVAASVRQIGRDLRRIADQFQASRRQKSENQKDPGKLEDAYPKTGMKTCVTGVVVVSGLLALLRRFLSE